MTKSFKNQGNSERHSSPGRRLKKAIDLMLNSSVEEAATAMSCSIDTVYRYIRDKIEIPEHRLDLLQGRKKISKAFILSGTGLMNIEGDRLLLLENDKAILNVAEISPAHLEVILKLFLCSVDDAEFISKMISKMKPEFYSTEE